MNLLTRLIIHYLICTRSDWHRSTSLGRTRFLNMMWLRLLLMDESQGALRCGTRIEAFYDVALHATMPEVYVALVDTGLVSSTDTANHRADQVG